MKRSRLTNVTQYKQAKWIVQKETKTAAMWPLRMREITVRQKAVYGNVLTQNRSKKKRVLR